MSAREKIALYFALLAWQKVLAKRLSDAQYEQHAQCVLRYRLREACR